MPNIQGTSKHKNLAASMRKGIFVNILLLKNRRCSVCIMQARCSVAAFFDQLNTHRNHSLQHAFLCLDLYFKDGWET